MTGDICLETGNLRVKERLIVSSLLTQKCYKSYTVLATYNFAFDITCTVWWATPNVIPVFNAQNRYISEKNAKLLVESTVQRFNNVISVFL